LKLNGKTALRPNVEPYSPQLCSVSEAIRLGAKAVGYTIYVGSEHEATMMKEFSAVEDEAHAAGLPVILWAYPRGASVAGRENSGQILSYAARLSLELGADFVKLPYTGDPESYAWVVKAAGKTGVLVQGGAKTTEKEFLEEIRECKKAGVAGFAIGRNIWQSDDPAALAKKVADIAYES
jgi:class I fructose-bisphosphate aldolase